MALGRIHVGIPTGDGRLHNDCARGLLSLWGRHPCSLSMVNGSLIGRNRDIISAEALLRDDVSHVLFVDSDMAWSVEDVERLLELDVAFAAGRYVQKTSEARWNEQPSGGRPTKVRGIDALELDRVGAGFMLVARSALHAMSVAAPRYAHDGRELRALWWGNHALGEDYAFCDRWTALGGFIYARPDVVLAHVGLASYLPAQ